MQVQSGEMQVRNVSDKGTAGLKCPAMIQQEPMVLERKFVKFHRSLSVRFAAPGICRACDHRTRALCWRWYCEFLPRCSGPATYPTPAQLRPQVTALRLCPGPSGLRLV